MAAVASLLVPVACGGGISSGKKRKARYAREAKLEAGWSGTMQQLRRDGEFIRTVVPPVVDSLFWLRFLEAQQRYDDEPPSPPLRTVEYPYPQGLSCVELLVLDVEFLKFYLHSWGYYLMALFTPLPQSYNPDIVAQYFNLRPHVIAQRIIEVLVSFVYAAVKLQISRRVKITRRFSDRSEEMNTSGYYFGQLLKEVFLRLGPTFVKVGQSLSTRPDIIGSEVAEALAELHEKVPPFTRETAMEIIEEELGRPYYEIFGYISEEPVAAASFGQVYQGHTADGTIVAIKVQRPNLLPSVLRDIYILRLGLSLFKKIAKRRSDPALYADELGRGFVGELDYTLEAANAFKFQEAHCQYSFMQVPTVLPQFTRKRVLTMQWMIGENPNKLLLLSKGFSKEKTQCSEREKLEAKARLFDLVNKGVESTLVQLLETGLLHADPHPGNLRYTPEGCIGFLDFGLLCSMEKRHQLAMLACIVHIANGDWAALVYDLTEMDIIPLGTNLHRVTMDLEASLGEVAFNGGIPDIKLSKVLSNILSVALKYHLRMPPYFTLVLRSLASFEGLAVAVDRNFRTFEAAYPFVFRKLVVDNSLATRRILYSVVFNERNTLQWQKVLLFLRLVSARSKNLAEAGKLVGFTQVTQETPYQTATILLRLLLSRDGVVVRRILMTADAKSLARDILSQDGLMFRQFVAIAIAELLYNSMMKGMGFGTVGRSERQTVMLRRKFENNDQLPPLPSSTSTLIQSIFEDRRLKIIFFKFVKDVSQDPILILRLSWKLLIISISAAAVAVHRCIVHLCDEYVPPSYRSAQIVGTV